MTSVHSHLSLQHGLVFHRCSCSQRASLQCFSSAPLWAWAGWWLTANAKHLESEGGKQLQVQSINVHWRQWHLWHQTSMNEWKVFWGPYVANYRVFLSSCFSWGLWAFILWLSVMQALVFKKMKSQSPEEVVSVPIITCDVSPAELLKLEREEEFVMNSQIVVVSHPLSSKTKHLQ